MTQQRAFIIGASGGIGSALVSALSDWEVVTLSRSEDGFDICDEASVRVDAERLSGPFDLIFDATGALEIDGVGPEKSLSAIEPDVMARQFAVNAIGPALIFKHFMEHLPKDRRGLLVSLSARVGSIDDNRLGGWISYRAAKAALNQIVKTTSIELARVRKEAICVAIHPGTVQDAIDAKYVGHHPSVPPSEAAQNILNVLNGLTVGDTGGFFDWTGAPRPVVKLVLVLGDQLSPDLSALNAGDKARDIVLMAEVMGEASYVPHHPKKIALIFAAMRKFALELEGGGWTVDYVKLGDEANTGTLTGEIDRAMARHGADQVLTTEAGEWRVRDDLFALPYVTMLPDDRFIATEQEFRDWADGRKELRMEFFYRNMRRKTGLLMDGDKPVGGKWNYDAENRKPASADLFMPKLYGAKPDEITRDVLDLVADRFGGNFGDLEPFHFATDRAGAEAAAKHFIAEALPRFGDFQDAMLTGEPFLYHSILSIYLNIGLIKPLWLCELAEDAYRAGEAPLNAVEGFIRQIIGWREYIRGIYFWSGRDYTSSNFLEGDRELPSYYWSGRTKMHCMAQAIGQTKSEAYAHHIQRLMVTGNFAMLAGVDPTYVHQWYLAVYADAFEWVEAPNVIGMSQFADGGVLASKPYASSGAYIDRMSDYCGSCAYDVKDKTGEKACPFNALYWDFLDRNRDKLGKNQRLGLAYRNWDRMSEGTQEALKSKAKATLQNLDQL